MALELSYAYVPVCYSYTLSIL